jgi:predicted phage-related endonuclease
MLTEEQKAARKGRITSSVVAAVLGQDDWASPYDALLKIDGNFDFEGNAATERGNLLEQVVLDYAAQKTGLRFAPAPFVGDKAPWSGDSADGLLYDASGALHAVLEAKTVTMHAMGKWGEEGTDDVPERVIYQAHWHLLHHPAAKTCFVPVLFGGDFVFRLYELPRDEEFEKFIWREAGAWHRHHVVHRLPVAISGSDSDRQQLLKRNPRDWDALKACDDTLRELIERRMAAHEASKKAEKELALLNNQLREAIGDSEGIDASAHGYSVTYRRNADGAKTDWKAVARTLGVDEKTSYQHTTVEPGARVLRVAKKTKKEVRW